MNIDLLLTKEGEAGLVSDQALGGPLAGVMFEVQSGQLTLEFADADSLELNVPLALDFSQLLRESHAIHIGVVLKGVVADSRQVPLILQDDPFGGGNRGRFAAKPGNSVLEFENFMKRATTGQPVHRDDLGNEASASSVLSGLTAASLQFAPALARQRALEAAPKAAPAPRGPSGPSGPGGMGGGGGSQMPPPRPPTGRGDNES